MQTKSLRIVDKTRVIKHISVDIDFNEVEKN